MSWKAIVGPTTMYVECHGVRSEKCAITETDGPAEVRQYAKALWETIRPLVSWLVWVTHRSRMARQRRFAAMVKSDWPGPYFPGPNPRLIAQKPWSQAISGEWKRLPPGVVARLLRNS
jgi:hypothetical protein